jgi:hypothetical protein
MLKYGWCVLRVLSSLISPLGTVLADEKNSLPKIDGWRMKARAIVLGPGVGWCVPPASLFCFLLRYIILGPASCTCASTRPQLRLHHLPAYPPRVIQSSPSDSRRPAGTAPSDPNRDESPYEYVDACRCVWVRLVLSFPRFRSCYVSCGFDSNCARALGTVTSTTTPGKCTPPCCPQRNERLRLGALPSSCSSYPFRPNRLSLDNHRNT